MSDSTHTPGAGDTPELAFTGERFIPGCQGEIVYEHWHRYLLAAEHVTGRRVLDIACGEGYGSAMLARTAADVTGIDISAEAVAHAGRRYGDFGNLRYLQASCDRIPLADACCDVVVTFETIEHIHTQQAFVEEIARVLAPGGMLVMSSPNRDEYSTVLGHQNEFHVRELDGPELRELLHPHFPAQRWFAQRPCFHSLVWPLDQDIDDSRMMAVDGARDEPEPLYYLVFCGRSEEDVSAVGSTLSLVADADRSVYREWSRTYAENRRLHERNRELREQLARAKVTDAAAPTRPSGSPLARLLRRWLGG